MAKLLIHVISSNAHSGTRPFPLYSAASHSLDINNVFPLRFSLRNYSQAIGRSIPTKATEAYFKIAPEFLLCYRTKEKQSNDAQGRYWAVFASLVSALNASAPAALLDYKLSAVPF